MTTLMVRGTTSDAGKSTLVTALCRWLKRQGVAVVPFKPQNMALNSAVTADGGEIGRAQAVQAQACGLAPHRHEPGAAQAQHRHRCPGDHPRPRRHLDERRRLPRLQEGRHAGGAGLPPASGGRLSGGDGGGAGSPAEINLRANDIANMGFAEAVDCPVILIADIDRGGVFAHLVGTLALLSERAGTGEGLRDQPLPG